MDRAKGTPALRTWTPGFDHGEAIERFRRAEVPLLPGIDPTPRTPHPTPLLGPEAEGNPLADVATLALGAALALGAVLGILLA